MAKIIEWILMGGWAMLPLTACFIYTMSIIIDRMRAMRAKNIINKALIQEIHEWEEGQIPASITELCQKGETLMDRMVLLCIKNVSYPKYDNAQLMSSMLQKEIQKLEAGTPTLRVFSTVGPHIGLFGTILGLTTVFYGAYNSGKELADQGPIIAKGIAEAFNTTLLGLINAIAAVAGLAWIDSRIEKYYCTIDSICNELMGKMYDLMPEK